MQALRAAYYATVSYLDSLIGRVLAALDASGHAENTLIVYTSDHGFSLGDHYIFGLFHMFEESLKVPLIMSGPGIPVEWRISSPVSHVDLYPTIIEAAGLATTPEEKNLMAQSLWPLLTKQATGRSAVFAEYHGTATRSGGYVLRGRRHKLIHFVGMPPQLFDLMTDPYEAVNLATDPASRAVLEQMTGALLARVDPVAIDATAKASQAALIEAHGGKEAVLRKMGGFSYSPPPGVRWQDMEGNQNRERGN